MLLNKLLLLQLAALFFMQCTDSGRLSESVRLCSGDINGAVIENNGKSLVVYGDPDNRVRKAEMVLFTDFRRDVIWAGRKLVQHGSVPVAPAAEKEYFTRGDSIWKKWSTGRFHNYYCQTTKIGNVPIKDCRFVRDGEILEWEGIGIKIIATPGFSRGSISYIADVDGKRYAFTGDLLYGDGKIIDLYSFQDSLKGILGYHGYAVRLGQLVSSLEKIAKEKPDIIIPSRGPVITDPESSIRKLIGRVQALYRNYLSTSAYRWYFPERMKILSDHVTGSYDSAGYMPYSKFISNNPPAWFTLNNANSNSRLIIADDGSAFLIDCGMKDVFEHLKRLRQTGQVKGIDGIFITHYHDDHTDYINDVVKEFKCPVYVTRELKDILENPGAYNLPCLTKDPIRNLTIMQDNQQMHWKEFTLTFYYFPGQTLYHDAVLFKKDNGEAVFFIGDSFTPSGIDDYCLLNRNLLHEKTGYFYCLDILKKLPEKIWLCNQHVEPLFAFSRQQLDYMTNALVTRRAILEELFPWDDINYGLDEQWAHLYPYGQKASPGQTIELSATISNHSGVSQKFILKPKVPENFDVTPGQGSIEIDPLNESTKTFKVKISEKAQPGIYLLTFDIGFDDHNLHEWCEALIEIEPGTAYLNPRL